MSGFGVGAATPGSRAGAELTSVAYNSNGSSTVTDANGNQYTIGVTTQFGLMKASAVSGAPAPSLGGSAFTYDTNGFIASKTDFDGNVTTYTHDARGDDGAGHLSGEYDAQGRAIHEIVYLGDLPVAVLDGTNCFGEWRTATNVHYINPDNLGAPHIITDERNRKVWQWNHAPFGDGKALAGAPPTPVQPMRSFGLHR
jgi:uncharacterized protein RhaS with RHS repeats